MTDRRAFLALFGLTGAGLVLSGRSTKADAAFAIHHTPAEWRRMLGAQRYAVLREAATERPFSSPLNKEHRRGTFAQLAGGGAAGR